MPFSLNHLLIYLKKNKNANKNKFLQSSSKTSYCAIKKGETKKKERGEWCTPYLCLVQFGEYYLLTQAISVLLFCGKESQKTWEEWPPVFNFRCQEHWNDILGMMIYHTFPPHKSLSILYSIGLDLLMHWKIISFLKYH